MKIIAYSNKGSRKENQDCFGIGDKTYYNDEYEENIENKAFFVFDGVGSGGYGDVASKEACQMFLHLINESDVSENRIREVLKQVNNHILDLSKVQEKPNSMGTTIAGIYVSDESIYCINVGDSRVYRYAKGMLFQVSSDDSLYEEARMLPSVTDEFLKSINKHVITHSLGNKNFDENRININVFDRRNGNLFLICSDGLTDMVSDEIIHEILMQDNLIYEKNEFCRVVEENGAIDNFTFILVQL